MNPFARTFHPDEANQAFTVGHLLETGIYTYRPTDHHGPTLYYAAAPLQHLAGRTSTAQLDPTLLRATPLAFAVLTLVFLALAVMRVARPPARPRALNEELPPSHGLLALGAALLLGTAPLFVFFATDFIQEMLLAAFLVMMFWAAVGFCGAFATPPPAADLPAARRSLLPLKPGSWALLFGIAAGLAYATKETCVISFGAAGLAALPFLPAFVRHLRTRKALGRLATPLILGALAFAVVSAVLYSSFGQNWQGVRDAFITAPLSYLHRAAGDAASEGAAWHVHPWWQYFAWLFHSAPFEETLLFTFPTVFVPLLIALARFFRKRPSPTVLALRARAAAPARQMGASATARFTVTHTVPERTPAFNAYLFTLAYSVVLMAVYALIPYKTPWCALQFLPGLVLASVFGLRTLQERLPLPRACHTFAAVVIFGAIVAFRLPALQIVWNEPDSNKIPFNYANASPEVQQLAHDVAVALDTARVALTASDGTDRPTPPTAPQPIFAAVALPSTDTWPFPFYNRAHESQTGYWTSLQDLLKVTEAGARPTVVVVPLAEGHLAQAQFPDLAHTKRYYIRPGVRVRAFWK